MALLLLVGVLALAGGCKHDDYDSSNNITVAFAGYYVDGTSHNLIPCYWDDNGRTTLDVGSSTKGYAFSPAVIYDGAVYSAGLYYTEAGSQPCYWRGSTRVDLTLPLGMTSCYTSAIAVRDGTVYVAGYYYDGSADHACYWVDDGDSITLTILHAGDPDDTYAEGIAVDDEGTVYTAGGYYDGDENYIACYWTDDEPTDLTTSDDSDDSTAFTIALADGVVYAGGYIYDGEADEDVPCYWTDDGEGVTRVTLDLGEGYQGFVSALALSGTTVYAVGVTYDGSYDQACCWTDLQDGSDPTIAYLSLPEDANYSSANGVTVVDGEVYIGGFYYSEDADGEIACVWNDDDRWDLDQDGAVNSRIYSAFQWWD